jgi:hypothetical protein
MFVYVLVDLQSWGLAAMGRVTRWVFEKRAQSPKCSPTHFCQNQYTTFTVENSSRKIGATYVPSFKKTAQRNQSLNMRKVAQSGHTGYGLPELCLWRFYDLLSFLSLLNRVTRLGEFSPNGWLFTLASFFENLLKHPTFLGYLFPRQGFCVDSDKNGLGYILGDFFTNSSGHPASELPPRPSYERTCVKCTYLSRIFCVKSFVLKLCSLLMSGTYSVPFLLYVFQLTYVLYLSRIFCVKSFFLLLTELK